ncbi:MAG: hypothetical protein J6Y38_00100 [Bacteroidaceae bacterium]|nr:hypothetical protein [Bacteroidaceae bacterium]
MKRALLLFVCGLSFVVSFAQNNKDWEPTGVWPFINKQFRTATVYTGIFKRSKTVVPCNIHVGNQTLWYSQNDTLMEAIPGSVLRVVFPNGDTYMPVGSESRFGRIVREDSIDGRVARVICVRSVNQEKLDQKYLDYLNKTQNLLQGSLSINGVSMNMTDIASADDNDALELQPLPLTNEYYFQVRGEVFPATTKQILTRIDSKRKQEYRNFTRSAEIISSNESSMMKVWEEFFLK